MERRMYLLGFLGRLTLMMLNSMRIALNDNKKTQNILKSQVQVVSSAIRNFNESSRTLKVNENLLNENIKLVNVFASDTNLHLHQLKIESLIIQQIRFLSAFTYKVLHEYNENIEAINLGIHNIVSPFIIIPNDLCKELQQYSGDLELILEPKYENMWIFFKLLKLQIVLADEIIVYVLKFPLTKQSVFDLFDLISFPIQHGNTSLLSYIEPRSRYLLLSQSKTVYSTMHVLSDCEEYLEGKYLCTNIHVSKVLEEAACEIRLLAPSTMRIPDDCIVRTIKAEDEIWKYIGHNSWIYSLQKSTTVTILCGGDTDHMEDAIVYKNGIFQIQGQCKGYTSQYLLEPTKLLEKNITYIVPEINITEDDCCIPISEFHKTNPMVLKPIRLSSADQSDLRFANKKLEEIDKLLVDRAREPFMMTHTKWYIVAMYILGSFVFLVVCTNFCRWLSCWRIMQRIFCFMKSSNAERSLPAIKNYVNCTFDSEIRREYREASRDLIVYRSGGANIGATEEAAYLDEDIVEAEFNNLPSQSTRSFNQGIKYRRSTTPL
ncbi:uncharacterized protein LOC143264351 [Megachile rotundata]|uniref:uncharacterized protein LOC143264351 n=1 Tax=Megachile rotundata TaxID=143995 RepID=UPI003FD620E6